MRAEVYLETNVSKVSDDLDTLTGAVMHERHPKPVKAMILITCAVKADTHPVPVNSSHIYHMTRQYETVPHASKKVRTRPATLRIWQFCVLLLVNRAKTGSEVIPINAIARRAPHRIDFRIKIGSGPRPQR
jgi:hypothetical protein